MSFMETIRSFFTLKTSDELRAAAYYQAKIDRRDSPENAWLRNLHNLDRVTNYMTDKYSSINANLVKAKDILIKLLGNDLLCLLNEPILQCALVEVKDVPNSKPEGAIILQWATGNNNDEMTVMFVAFDGKDNFRVTCATKCIGVESNVKASYASNWATSVYSLPDWFKEILELIKFTHTAHIVQPDPSSRFNLDNLINAKVSQYAHKLEAIKMCSEVVSWILHDEYQDLAYYPKVRQTSCTDNEHQYSIWLEWLMPNDEKLRLKVIKHHRYGFLDVEFTIKSSNRVETVFKLATEDEAKQVIIPNWFIAKLEQVKNSTFGDQDKVDHWI